MSAIEFRDLASGKPWTEEKQQRREPPKTCPGVRSEKRPGLKPLKPCVEGMTAVAAMMSPKLRTILRQASSSLERGHSPQLTPEGLGGTYVLTDPEARPIAVFKPCDEEPSAPNNPKRRAENLGHHVRAGEAALRECAAFLLDHERFAGVPETTFAKSACAAYFDASESGGASGAATPRQLKEKVGSLQEFVDSDCSAEEVGPALFSVGNVHRIAIFDIRVCNTDRHAGNLLVRWTRTASGDRSAELIPIDHGFCLPERLEEPTFDWYCWPQAKQPLSAAELAYIAALDADRDAELLRQALPIRPECFRTLKICTLFLQKAAKAGLTLFDMAGLMLLTGAASPRDAPAESALQQLVHEAEAQATVKVARVSSLVSAERQQLMRTKYFFRLFEAALDHFLADWARERHGDHGRLSDSSGCSPVSAASADTASSADLGHGPADCDFPGDRFRRRPVPGRDFSLVLVDSSPLAEKVPPALLAAADTP